MVNTSELIISPFTKMQRAYLQDGAFNSSKYAWWKINGTGIISSSFSGTIQLKGNSIVIFSRNKVTFSTGLLQYCAQVITYDKDSNFTIYVNDGQSVKQNDDIAKNNSSTINWHIQYVPIKSKSDFSINSTGQAKSSVRTINDFLEGQGEYW